jgi:hypothetical protein
MPFRHFHDLDFHGTRIGVDEDGGLVHGAIICRRRTRNGRAGA